MEPKRYSVAVIIPAYNAGLTLARTVKSVLGQTLIDIQIIIVDDGSDDGTASIADKFAATENRVQVIHQQNRGCYAARLAGLKAMDASYFGFVDADDVIEPNMYETLYNYAVQHDFDIVQCGIAGKNDNDQSFEILDEDAFNKRIVHNVLLQGKGAALVWDKLYRNQYDFDSMVVDDYGPWEDHAFNLYFFQRVTRYGIIHQGLYHYCVNDNSVTRNYNPRMLVRLENICRLRRLYGYKVWGMTEYEESIWITRTARNLFVMMSYVKFSSWVKRYNSVCELIRMPEVVYAHAILRQRLSFRCGIVVFWFFSTRFTWLMVVLIFCLKKIQQCRG